MAPPAASEPASSHATSLTVVILTRDEERHIERAIASIARLATRIIVVDSGSTDRTLEIARAARADVFQRTWVNYADQFQWALDHGGIDTQWSMRLDADEWLGQDLVANLTRAMAAADPNTGGFSCDRRHYFLGRWIRHGGRYPLRLLRVWRTGAARIEQRWMDEHMVLDRGRIAHVEGEFVDENLGDLSFFVRKHDAYATREALDVLVSKYDLFPAESSLTSGSTAQAKRTRTAKTRFYNHLPVGVGPVGYFFYRYVLQLGFLDGKAGLIYHCLQGFWYRFLVDAKRYEFERELADCPDRETRIERLSQVSGYDLRAFHGEAARDE